jgi:hypothetical protein
MQDSETLEIVDLESLLTDELHCEAPTCHDPSNWWYVPCSHSVTHRIYACVHPQGRNVCQNATDSALRDVPTTNCADCRRLASECWRIIPI